MTRIAVIYNEPIHTAPEDHWLARTGGAPGGDFRDGSEFGVLDEVRLIAASLDAAGHTTTLFAPRDAPDLCRFLDITRPELVFNCCETFGGDPGLEMNVAAVFELFGIPYSGSPATALCMALDKRVTKALLLAAGIPTPAFAVADNADELATLRIPGFPIIVKPLREDASNGIDDAAVVHDEDALAARVAFVVREFRQPALIEEFIAGRELNVSLLAASPADFHVLPVSEILFDGLPDGCPQIVGYEAKWIEDSPRYRGTVAQCPAVLDGELEARVQDLAVRAARALGIRDYGRVDLRVRRADGMVFVIEVNPNPDLNDNAGFLRAAQASGRSYASAVAEIAERAIERWRTDGRP